MICASKSRVTYPLDCGQLYWLTLGACGPDRYSPSSFFFASPDGSYLESAMNDVGRFTQALAAAIDASAGAQFVYGLQQLLVYLTAAATPPVPRYPQPGDTGVSGAAVWVRPFNYFKFNSVTKKFDIPVISWIGGVTAAITANHYSTPPANTHIQFTFQFQSFSEVCAGDAVTFDIAQGQYALGAVNIQPL